MHRSNLNLAAYFDRIGYADSTAPTLETLAGIHRRHPEAIPFESLNAFLELPVSLDIEAIQAKLVDGGRGGWCFEHNLLLSAVLRELEFSVQWLGARVLWNTPVDIDTPRTHMLLRVEIDGESFIADVGFGGMSLTAPLRFVADVEQSTPHGAFRLTESGSYHILHAQIKGEWLPLYRFEQNEQLMPDYEMANSHLCRPGSRFFGNIICARVDDGHRYALMNSDFAVHAVDGHSERRRIDDADELMRTLESVFKIQLPEPDRLRTALQAMLDRVAT